MRRDGAPRTPGRLPRLAAALGLASLAAGCAGEGARRVAEQLHLATPRPDVAPVMRNAELPFRYPAAQYVKRVQGNVTLRLFVDEGGHVVPESTRVEESSGVPALDSAALAGARELAFTPAMLRGRPIPISILFPVYFRHPEAAPLPGDSLVLPSPSTPRRQPLR